MNIREEVHELSRCIDIIIRWLKLNRTKHTIFILTINILLSTLIDSKRVKAFNLKNLK